MGRGHSPRDQLVPRPTANVLDADGETFHRRYFVAKQEATIRALQESRQHQAESERVAKLQADARARRQARHQFQARIDALRTQEGHLEGELTQLEREYCRARTETVHDTTIPHAGYAASHRALLFPVGAGVTAISAALVASACVTAGIASPEDTDWLERRVGTVQQVTGSLLTVSYEGGRRSVVLPAAAVMPATASPFAFPVTVDSDGAPLLLHSAEVIIEVMGDVAHLTVRATYDVPILHRSLDLALLAQSSPDCTLLGAHAVVDGSLGTSTLPIEFVKGLVKSTIAARAARVLRFTSNGQSDNDDESLSHTTSQMYETPQTTMITHHSDDAAVGNTRNAGVWCDAFETASSAIGAVDDRQRQPGTKSVTTMPGCAAVDALFIPLKEVRPAKPVAVLLDGTSPEPAGTRGHSVKPGKALGPKSFTSSSTPGRTTLPTRIAASEEKHVQVELRYLVDAFRSSTATGGPGSAMTPATWFAFPVSVPAAILPPHVEPSTIVAVRVMFASCVYRGLPSSGAFATSPETASMKASAIGALTGSLPTSGLRSQLLVGVQDTAAVPLGGFALRGPTYANASIEDIAMTVVTETSPSAHRVDYFTAYLHPSVSLSSDRGFSQRIAIVIDKSLLHTTSAASVRDAIRTITGRLDARDAATLLLVDEGRHCFSVPLRAAGAGGLSGRSNRNSSSFALGTRSEELNNSSFSAGVVDGSGLALQRVSPVFMSSLEALLKTATEPSGPSAALTTSLAHRDPDMEAPQITIDSGAIAPSSEQQAVFVEHPCATLRDAVDAAIACVQRPADDEGRENDPHLSTNNMSLASSGRFNPSASAANLSQSPSMTVARGRKQVQTTGGITSGSTPVIPFVAEVLLMCSAEHCTDSFQAKLSGILTVSALQAAQCNVRFHVIASLGDSDNGASAAPPVHLVAAAVDAACRPSRGLSTVVTAEDPHGGIAIASLARNLQRVVVAEVELQFSHSKSVEVYHGCRDIRANSPLLLTGRYSAGTGGDLAPEVATLTGLLVTGKLLKKRQLITKSSLPLTRFLAHRRFAFHAGDMLLAVMRRGCTFAAAVDTGVMTQSEDDVLASLVAEACQLNMPYVFTAKHVAALVMHQHQKSNDPQLNPFATSADRRPIAPFMSSLAPSAAPPAGSHSWADFVIDRVEATMLDCGVCSPVLVPVENASELMMAHAVSPDVHIPRWRQVLAEFGQSAHHLQRSIAELLVAEAVDRDAIGTEEWGARLDATHGFSRHAVDIRLATMRLERGIALLEEGVRETFHSVYAEEEAAWTSLLAETLEVRAALSRAHRYAAEERLRLSYQEEDARQALMTAIEGIMQVALWSLTVASPSPQHAERLISLARDFMDQRDAVALITAALATWTSRVAAASTFGMHGAAGLVKTLLERYAHDSASIAASACLTTTNLVALKTNHGSVESLQIDHWVWRALDAHPGDVHTQIAALQCVSKLVAVSRTSRSSIAAGEATGLKAVLATISRLGPSRPRVLTYGLRALIPIAEDPNGAAVLGELDGPGVASSAMRLFAARRQRLDEGHLCLYLSLVKRCAAASRDLRCTLVDSGTPLQLIREALMNVDMTDSAQAKALRCAERLCGNVSDVCAQRLGSVLAGSLDQFVRCYDGQRTSESTLQLAHRLLCRLSLATLRELPPVDLPLTPYYRPWDAVEMDAQQPGAGTTARLPAVYAELVTGTLHLCAGPQRFVGRLVRHETVVAAMQAELPVDPERGGTGRGRQPRLGALRSASAVPRERRVDLDGSKLAATATLPRRVAQRRAQVARRPFRSAATAAGRVPRRHSPPQRSAAVGGDVGVGGGGAVAAERQLHDLWPAPRVALRRQRVLRRTDDPIVAPGGRTALAGRRRCGRAPAAQPGRGRGRAESARGGCVCAPCRHRRGLHAAADGPHAQQRRARSSPRRPPVRSSQQGAIRTRGGGVRHAAGAARSRGCNRGLVHRSQRAARAVDLARVTVDALPPCMYTDAFILPNMCLSAVSRWNANNLRRVLVVRAVPDPPVPTTHLCQSRCTAAGATRGRRRRSPSSTAARASRSIARGKTCARTTTATRRATRSTNARRTSR
jgi:hypothetical protein